MFLLQVALYRKNKSFKHFVSHVVLLYFFTRNNQEQEKKNNKATGYGSDLSKYLYFSLTTEEADEAWG